MEITILYNKNEYKVETEKLLYILSCLENEEISQTDDAHINALLKKYGLLDEVFLENINKIW